MQDVLDTTGYCYIASLRPGTDALEIGNSLGEISAAGSAAPVELIPREQSEASPTSYSGLYGLNPFPFHTDLAHWRRPPRYLLLRCRVGSPHVKTHLVDGLQIAQSLDMSRLHLAHMQPRRPLKGKIPLLRLYSSSPDELVRWDDVFIQPANETARFYCASFRQAIQSAQCTSFALANEGDTLLIDNWRMLHSRSGVPFSARTRIIERTYLDQLNETDN